MPRLPHPPPTRIARLDRFSCLSSLSRYPSFVRADSLVPSLHHLVLSGRRAVYSTRARLSLSAYACIRYRPAPVADYVFIMLPARPWFLCIAHRPSPSLSPPLSIPLRRCTWRSTRPRPAPLISSQLNPTEPNSTCRAPFASPARPHCTRTPSRRVSSLRSLNRSLACSHHRCASICRARRVCV